MPNPARNWCSTRPSRTPRISTGIEHDRLVGGSWQAEPADPEIAQDYNVAPTKTSPVVVARTPKDTGDDLRRSAHQESFSNSSTSWRILMTCMANDSHRAGPHEIG
ncbi:hypothetical protein SIM91_44010 [Rhodococcus opacus]|uniref:hypothetical protein n=1 Tax=Rhodococcus opacus TaxID=37919 RepID=UPI0007CD59FD|nr:hypothetical protein [Rhodococcus opacus]MDX5970111.1 hypothetical protein [Rhodococcus opacus]